jgi:hypothetical protein
MILALLLQAATPPGPPPGPPLPPGQQMPRATVMAEPVALAIAGWDADGDGRTTRAELQAGAARSFAAIDTAGRGDMGYIGFADWAERWLGNRSALPSPFELDADQDDRISRAEFEAGLLRVFVRLDADKDGAVSRAEMLTIRPGLREPDPRDRDKKRRR